MQIPTMRLNAELYKGSNHTAIVSPIVGNYTIEGQAVWYYNGAEWFSLSRGQVVQGGGSTLYFTSIENGVGFETLSGTPDLSDIDSEVILLPTANTRVYLDHEYKAEGVIGTANIPAGQWGFKVYALAEHAGHSTYLTFDVGTNDGTETVWHFSVDSPVLASEVLTEYNFVSVQPEFSNLSTDKIVVRVSAISNTNNTSVTWTHSSSTAYSCITPPQLPVLHDNLGGLNAGDYKHLTTAEKTALDNLIAGNGAVFHHSINFPSSAIQASLVQGTPAWAGTLTAIKATISTVSTAALTFKAFKNDVEIGSITITAGAKIATLATEVAATDLDFFGASIVASNGDATGAILTFIFRRA